MNPAIRAGLTFWRRLPWWAAAACVVWSAGSAGASTSAPRSYGGGPTLTIARQPVTGSLPHAPSTDALLAPGAAPVRAVRRAYADLLLPQGRHAPHLDASWSLLPSAESARRARTDARGQAGFDFPILVIRVDFLSDSLNYQSTGDGRFDLRPYVDVNGDTVDVPIDPPPHNREFFRAHMAALDRFYVAQSHGEVSIHSEVFPVASDSAYHLPDVGRYGPWLLFRGYNPYDAAQAFVRDAVRAAANDPDIPWGDFTLDGREVRVMIFHSGPDLQSDIDADSPRDLPSFFIGLEDSVPIADGAYYVKYATVVPETANQDGAFGALNGVLAHETGHQLGLPDIYNTQIGLPVVGFWSLMDSGNLVAGPTEDPRNGSTIYVSGIIPPSLDAWSKAVLFPQAFLRGGFAPSLVDTLPAIENEAAILQVPISASEYFLLENRQTDVNGDDSIFVETDSLTHVILGPKAGRGDAPPLPEYDALLPGSGILVWHVDEEQIFRQFDNGYSLNDDPARPGLSVVEADGTYDLGDFAAFPFTVGSPWDPFYVGNADSITPSTSPSTRANGGGNSHLAIRILSESGLRMAVETTQAWLLPGFPFPLSGDTLGTGSPMVVDLFRDGTPWILTPASDKITGVSWQSTGGGTTLPLFGSGVFAASTDGASFRDEVAFGDNAFGGGVPATANAVAATTRSNELYVWNGAGIRVQLWPGLPPVTAAPSFLGNDLLVGCEDGRLYRLSMLGGFTAIGPSLGAPVVSTPRSAISGTDTLIAWASANGVIAVSGPAGVQTATLATATAWQPQVTLASFDGSFDVLLADRSGTAWRLDSSAQPRVGWPVTSGDSSHSAPTVIDLDGDGDQEIAIVSTHGVVSAWNANGSPVRLWPRQADVEAGDGGITMSTPLVTGTSGGGSSVLLLALGSGNVLLRAQGGAGVAGWPLSLNEPVHATPTLADITGDGLPDLLAPARDGLLYAYAPGDLACPPGGCLMPMLGHDPARTGAVVVPPTVLSLDGSALTTQMYVAPNPVRLSDGRTVRLGYSLPAGATSVTADVFDIAGRRIAQLSGGTSRNDNTIVWSLDDVPPGPYMCKLTVHSGSRSEEHVMMLAVRP